MKRPLLAFAILLCCFQSTFAKLTEGERTVADELYRQIGGSSVSEYRNGSRPLSESERILVIEKLRDEMEEIRRESPKDFEYETRFIVLDMAILGDDRSLAQHVDRYVKHDADGQNLMLAITNPKVIALLGEALFVEKKGSFNGHVGRLPPQWLFAEVILHNLRNSVEFKSDVRSWAELVRQRNHDGTRATNIVRDWYRANEGKLKTGDFKSINPGEEVPELKQLGSDDGRTRSQLGPLTPSPTTLKSSTIGTASSRSGSYGLIGGILFVTCGCIVWLFLRRYRGQL